MSETRAEYPGHLAFPHQGERLQQEELEDALGPGAQRLDHGQVVAFLLGGGLLQGGQDLPGVRVPGAEMGRGLLHQFGLDRGPLQLLEAVQALLEKLVVEEVLPGRRRQQHEPDGGARILQGAHDPDDEPLGQGIAVLVGLREGHQVPGPGHGPEELGALGGHAGIALAFHEPAEMVGGGLLALEQGEFAVEDDLEVRFRAGGLQGRQDLHGPGRPEQTQGRAPFVEDPEVLFGLEGLEEPGRPFGPVELGDGGQDGPAQAPRGPLGPQARPQLGQGLLLEGMHLAGQAGGERAVPLGEFLEKVTKRVQRGERDLSTAGSTFHPVGGAHSIILFTNARAALAFLHADAVISPHARLLPPPGADPFRRTGPHGPGGSPAPIVKKADFAFQTRTPPTR